MAYDPATYVPGDAWETIEHFQRAVAAPRIVETLSTAGDTTTPSYFEYRKGVDGNNPRTFALNVNYASGSGAFVAVLERSNDDGASWTQVQSFDQPISKDVNCGNLAMFRVRVASIEAGTTIEVSLLQYL